MSQPGDPIGAESEQGAPTEGIVGWARVGCLVFLQAVVPIWFLLTATVVQLSDIEVLSLEPGAEGARHSLAHWVQMGGMVALYMVLALPFVAAAITIGRMLAETQRVRSEAQRAALDEALRADAVIEDPAWAEPQPEPEASDGIHSAPS